MPSTPPPPPMSPTTGDPSEEEEELGTLPNARPPAPLPARLEASTSTGNHSFASDVACLRSGRGDAASKDVQLDEFAVEIEFVSAKGSKSRAGFGAFVPPSSSSDSAWAGGLQRHPSEQRAAHRATAPQQPVGVAKKPSIAGSWDSMDSAALNKYAGSDPLDDTDRAGDEAEFRAWKLRDVSRRKELLQQ